MALVLVRLKLALVRSTLRSANIEGKVGAIVAIVVAVAVGATGGALFAFARLAPARLATDIAIGGFAVLFVVWVLGPIATATSDGTLPPERLAPFPLRAAQLMPGLLLASAVGFGGLLSLLVLVGAVVGLAPPSPLAAVTIAAAVCQLAACVVFSRAVISAISAAVRRRRARDIALIVGPVLMVTMNLGMQILLRASFESPTRAGIDSGAWRAAKRVLVLLPSGPPALAAGWAREGRPGPALGALAASAVVVVVGLVLWRAALDRAMTTVTGGSGGPLGRARSLYPWFLRPLPRNRRGAVAARELRLTWRDPRQRAALLGSLIAPVIVVVGLRTVSSGDPAVVLLGVLPTQFIAIGAANLWGFDGRAAWMDVSAAGDPRDDVVGKVVARAFIAVAASALAIVGLAARVGSFARAPHAVALSVGAFGLITGLAVVLAVRNPQPMPESTTNVFSAGQSGQGLLQAVTALGLMFGSALVLVPVALVFAFASSAALHAAAGAFVVALGAASLAIGVQAAGRYLRVKGPELLTALDPTRS